MSFIGYHASHEQFSPADLLRWAQHAEDAGFGGVLCSDHFAPWSETQGESGFAWSWLGAAMQATSLPFGTVNAPGDRYHPAIVAQAIATLNVMFPGRFWVALGSGEAINEHITGNPWPLKSVRNARLKECAEVIRALLAGETVTHDGLVTVHNARIWSCPETMPTIFGAALSEETARVLGTWADGMITVQGPPDSLRRMIAAFREVAGDDAPVYVQSHISWAATDEEARENAFDQWKTNVIAGDLGADLSSVAHFAAATAHVRPNDLDAAIRISADLGQHRAWIEQDLALGVQGIFLHNVGRNQAQFIETFGEHILPDFRGHIESSH
ncbi:MAG TPA: TIGR03885 family FMN-dependent LLM class oxidoreductase [Thermomicrobiales bacterium]|nr:TIGR03885 family FMN-dependent LLM class oxidoreductase [Thermomicrobiales bacterium]